MSVVQPSFIAFHFTFARKNEVAPVPLVFRKLDEIGTGCEWSFISIYLKPVSSGKRPPDFLTLPSSHCLPHTCLPHTGLEAICMVFLWLMIDMGETSPLWAVPSPRRWSSLYARVVQQPSKQYYSLTSALVLALSSCPELPSVMTWKSKGSKPFASPSCLWF